MYDVKMHTPQQIENMLMSEREGDLGKFELSVNNLKQMFSDNGIIQDINDYEKERDSNIENENKKALEHLKTALDGKSYEQVLQDLNDIETKRQEAINKILLSFMDVVKTYVLGYMPGVKIQGYD